jgi:uncharacterized protein with HEPN domain
MPWKDAWSVFARRLCGLGDAAEELVPGQPWPDIRGMGNWLRHAYDRVDRDTIWDTIHANLPGLKDGVAAAIARLRAV